jgi:hypothetical protein
MMNKKATLLSWILFTIIAGLSIFSLVYSFSAERVASQEVLVTVGDVLLGLLPIFFAMTAVLILSRQPRNAIGWLLMLPALALAPSRAFEVYFGSLASFPQSPSAAFVLAYWFYGWHWLLLIFPIFFIMLLFPTGRPVTARWRWITYYLLGVSLYFFIVIAFSQSLEAEIGLLVRNPVGFVPDDWFDKYLWVTFGAGLLSATVLSTASIIIRYRRGENIEREQIKWLLYACGLFAAVYITMIFTNIPNREWGTPPILYILLPLALMALPAAVAVAILRYRLWDIDLIIRKTLLYAVLTATLALVFFGGVALLQQVFGGLTGTENSPIAIVVSTLVIAALVNPLRKKVQDFIDRRFYRKKYNAEQALARFAAVARDETDIDQLSAELLDVVQETMQPQIVSLWLKPAKRR